MRMRLIFWEIAAGVVVPLFCDSYNPFFKSVYLDSIFTLNNIFFPAK